MVIEALYYESTTELGEARRHEGTHPVKDMIYGLQKE